MFGHRRRQRIRDFEDGVREGQRRVTHDLVAAAVQTARAHEDAGFTRGSAVEAAVSGDLSRLEHTGLARRPVSPSPPTNPGKPTS